MHSRLLVEIDCQQLVEEKNTMAASILKLLGLLTAMCLLREFAPYGTTVNSIIILIGLWALAAK